MSRYRTMFKFLKVTAPLPLIIGVLILNLDGDISWWKMALGVFLVAWGLAFIQAPIGR